MRLKDTLTREDLRKFVQLCLPETTSQDTIIIPGSGEKSEPETYYCGLCGCRMPMVHFSHEVKKESRQ